MKRLLLGSTALIAAGFIAGSADAAEKITLGVGGYYRAAFGVVNEDDDTFDAGDNRRSHDLAQDAEVHFKGSTKLDNGIEVGARIELEGASGVGDPIDERYINFKGAFGEVRIGDDDDGRKQATTGYAPSPTPNTFGVNSPAFTFNNAGAGHITQSVSTFRSLENDSAKVIYFTPAVQGFRFIGSYAPDATQDRTGFGTSANNNCNQSSEALAGGVSYSGELNGVKVNGGGGYGTADREDGCAPGAQLDDPEFISAGIILGFGAIQVGGSILLIEDGPVLGVPMDESTEFDIGGTYALDGGVLVGGGWGRGEYSRMGGGEDTLNHYQAGASMPIGPGISVEAFVGYFNYNAALGLAGNNGWQAGVGTGLSF